MRSAGCLKSSLGALGWGSGAAGGHWKLTTKLLRDSLVSTY